MSIETRLSRAFSAFVGVVPCDCHEAEAFAEFRSQELSQTKTVDVGHAQVEEYGVGFQRPGPFQNRFRADFELRLVAHIRQKKRQALGCVKEVIYDQDFEFARFAQ
jgi:AraC-like DNA-binding protein